MSLDRFTQSKQSSLGFAPGDARGKRALPGMVFQERYQTNDERLAVVESSEVLSPHQLTITGRRTSFLAQGRVRAVGGVSLLQMSYGSEVAIDRAPQDNYIALLIPLSGAIAVRFAGTEMIVDPAHGVLGVSPGEGLHMRWSEGATVLALLARHDALQDHLAQWAPHTGGSAALHLTAPLIAGRARLSVVGLAHFLAGVLDRYDDDNPMPALIARQLTEQTLSTVLLALPHNHSDDLFRATPRPQRQCVRTAVDLLLTESRAVYTIGDLAAAAGVSVRALELGFQRELDTTPQRFIRDLRLDRARDELLRTDTKNRDTVTSVALRWGFGHTGRFAARYRERYGVAPSHTLRGGTAPQ